jgi:hypothetical protein
LNFRTKKEKGKGKKRKVYEKAERREKNYARKERTSNKKKKGEAGRK